MADDTGHKKAAGEYLKTLTLGHFPIPIANVIFTEHSRQTNPKSVDELVNNITANGWMPNSTPIVMVQDLPPGDKLTEETAARAKVHVLDGNHRLKAAQRVYKDDPEKTVNCMCIRHIDDPVTKQIVSDDCNTATETFKKRSTYDNIFFYVELFSRARSMMQASSTSSRRGRRSNAAKGTPVVTLNELNKMYKNLPVRKQVTDSTLRQYLVICSNMSSEALETLKLMEHQGVAGVEKISKNFLLKSGQFHQLNDTPQEQALFLQIYARSPEKDAGGSTDVQTAIKDQAIAVAAWRRGVALVVPKASWSTGFSSLVDEYALFGKPSYFTTYIQPHMQDLDAHVEKLESDLPRHADKLSSEEVNIIRAKPIGPLKRSFALKVSKEHKRLFTDEALIGAKKSTSAKKF